MAVYWLCFAVSILLIGFTEKKQKVTFITASFFALLIPCLIAALRADTVGTDIGVYVKPMFEKARDANSFSEYWNSSWFCVWRLKFVYEHEFGFSALVYAASKLTGNLGGVLFCIQACTIVPIFTALALNKKNAPVWPGMLVYFLMYYNCTLNMMRQWMAMGVLLLVFQLLLQKKYWVCMILFCIAFLFHYSSLLLLPIVAVWWFLGRFNRCTLVQGRIRISAKTLMVILIFMVGVLVLLNLKLILQLIVQVGLSRFSSYLKGNDLSLMLGQVILRLPVILITLFSWRRLRKATPEAPFFLAMLLLDLLASQLVSIADYTLRISFFFSYFSILLVPYLFKYQKSRFEKTVVALIMIGYCVLYWLYFYVYLGAHETYPYYFSFMRY